MLKIICCVFKIFIFTYFNQAITSGNFNKNDFSPQINKNLFHTSNKIISSIAEPIDLQLNNEELINSKIASNYLVPKTLDHNYATEDIDNQEFTGMFLKCREYEMTPIDSEENVQVKKRIENVHKNMITSHIQVFEENGNLDTYKVPRNSLNSPTSFSKPCLEVITEDFSDESAFVHSESFSEYISCGCADSRYDENPSSNYLGGVSKNYDEEVDKYCINESCGAFILKKTGNDNNLHFRPGGFNSLFSEENLLCSSKNDECTQFVLDFPLNNFDKTENIRKSTDKTQTLSSDKDVNDEYHHKK